MPQVVRSRTLWPFRLGFDFSGSGEVDGGISSYTLTSIGSLPFTLDTPTAPTISSTVTILSTDSDSTYLSSLSTSGRRTIVPARSSGQWPAIQGLANDTHVHLQDGAVCEAENLAGQHGAFFGGLRQWVTSDGGVICGGIRTFADARDTLVAGAKIWPEGSTATVQGSGETLLMLFESERLAILSCDIRALAGGVLFPVFVQQGITDFLFANNRLWGSDSTAGTFRGDLFQNLVIVDSLIRCTTGYAAVRFHNVCNNIYFGRNQVEANTQGIWHDKSSGQTQSNVWHIGNRIYGIPEGSQAPSFDNRGDGALTYLTADDNIWYTESGTPGNQMITGSGTGWDIGDNPIAAVTTPPTWTMQPNGYVDGWWE